MTVALDWSAIRDRVDLVAVATSLLGPAPGRRGEASRRPWWRCPFHDDKNPSLTIDSRKGRWRCFGCGEYGDAAKLVMKLNGVGFVDAIRTVSELCNMVGSTARSTGPPAWLLTVRGMSEPAKETQCSPDRRTGLEPANALTLVNEAAGRLWSPEGTEALTYLRARGLSDQTIRAARLGMVASVSIPTRAGDRYYRARGVVVPRFDGDRLALVKIRQPPGAELRYAEAYRDRPTLFPGPGNIRPGRPIVVVEGEFDALLVGQALGELAAVVTSGSAASKPEPAAYEMMLQASPWYVAHDADKAGDLAASGWPARARRVRPPGAFKDWTEAAQAGVNLRRWWSDRLGGTEAPALFSWPELAAQRWGPALTDPARKDGPVPYAIAEREAIRTEPALDSTEEHRGRKANHAQTKAPQ